MFKLPVSTSTINTFHMIVRALFYLPNNVFILPTHASVMRSKVSSVESKVSSVESKVSSVESKKNWMEILSSKKSLILEVAPKVNAKWKLIGRNLGISENVLDDIQSQVASKPDSAFLLMLEKWKNLKTSDLVIKTFITALESPEVGEQAVAKYMRDEMEGKYS